MMKTHTPYGFNLPVRSPPEIIDHERAMNSKKGTIRFPHSPLQPGQANSTSGKAEKGKALTPGGTPSGA